MIVTFRRLLVWVSLALAGGLGPAAAQPVRATYAVQGDCDGWPATTVGMAPG